MSNGAAVQTGPGLSAEDEAAHKQHLAEVYADEAEAAVEVIEAKLAGMKDSLKTAQVEAKRLRAEADKEADY